MQDFTKLKYAELRKLAKKAGIKANLKQEKLIAELTKYYETDEKQNVKQEDSVKARVPASVTECKIKKPSLQEKGTPVLVAKNNTPSKGLTTSSVNTTTPIQIGQSGTPGSAKPKSRWEKRVFSPAAAVRPASSNDEPAKPKVKEATPTTKLATPNDKPAGTPISNKAAGKRKHSGTPDVSQPAKKQKNSLENTQGQDIKSPTIDNTTKRKRSTFEKAPTPNLKTPEVGSPNRRRSGRQSTGTAESVNEMLGAMKDGMNSEEMKQSLMSVLDKRAQEKVKADPASLNTSTSIPRFAAFVKKRQESKPITPGNKNWEKIHQKNFEKFDPIDVYLNKKRKRAEEMTASVKKAKTLLGEVRTAVDKLKAHKTPDTNENKVLKPRTSNVNKTTPFKPTVLNTSKMNLNFGAKKSPKTLPRNSPKSVISSDIKFAQPAARKSTGSVAPRKSTTTPFKFNAPTTLNNTVASTRKPTFDLKASLARPITWKAHKGKLKPLEDSTKSPVYIKTLSAAKIKKDLSAAKIRKDRKETRMNVAKRRANKKYDSQMARRGIKM